MTVKCVLYTAAHSGFSLSTVPLGGGAAVCNQLVAEWAKTRPFDFQLLGPEVLGPSAPRGKDLVRFNEWEYARFCRRLEQTLTQQISQADARSTVVLSNDVSEGPDFRFLAGRGYSIYTIYHVDVVDYFARIYFRAIVHPETLTRAFAWLDRSPFRRWLPNVLKLIVEKQQDSVLYSKGLIVPSTEMKNILLRCYPQIHESKIHVLPWGRWPAGVDAEAAETTAAEQRRRWKIPDGAFVLLTLSRISPEKGQDRLLKAIEIWERRADFPQSGLWVFVAGEAAYMMGRRFEQRLRKLAARLRRTRVIFPGYAAGPEKQGLFRLADLYVFPSRHESYGLTLIEAMAAGLPALACDEHGSRELMPPGAGVLLPPAAERKIPLLMCEALARLYQSRAELKRMGMLARRHAEEQKFSTAAAQLASLLVD